MLSLDPILSKWDHCQVSLNFMKGNLYFTDSGPFLETSLENKQGSVFVYSF